MSPRFIGILFLLALVMTVLAIAGAIALLGVFSQLVCAYTAAGCR